MAPGPSADAGFQISLAATAALIAAFERSPDHWPPPVSPSDLVGGLDAAWRTLAGMRIASLAACVTADVFAVPHFQRVAVYGLAHNIASTPLISFAITPAAVLAAAFAVDASDFVACSGLPIVEAAPSHAPSSPRSYGMTVVVGQTQA